MKLEDARIYKKEIKTIYLSSFPREERAPLWFLFYKAKRDTIHFLAVVEEEKCIGLMYLVQVQDVMTLMYLALHDKVHGKGYGSALLKEVQTRFPDKKIFLNIEVVDKEAINYTQRYKRKAFYLRNQFKELDYQVCEFGVTYEMLSYGGYVSKDEYHKVMKALFGPFLHRIMSI